MTEPSSPQRPANTAYASAIEYCLSDFGKNRPGALSFDGQTFVVVDEHGAEVFSAHRSEVTKVSRLEFVLTIRKGKEKVNLTFGDRKQIAMAGLLGGLGAAGGAGSTAGGLAGSHVAFESIHEVSGLTGWTQHLEREGLMGSHLSTSTPVKLYVVYPAIGLGVIIVVAAIAAVAASL